MAHVIPVEMMSAFWLGLLKRNWPSPNLSKGEPATPIATPIPEMRSTCSDTCVASVRAFRWFYPR